MSDMQSIFETLLAAQAGKSNPPVTQWSPTEIRDIDLRIDADGRWFHQGGEIKRMGLVRVFASVLRRDGDEYFLVTPREKFIVRVVDAPLIVVDFTVQGHDAEQQVLFSTNTDEHMLIDTEHPLSVRHGVPYVDVHRGLQAKFNRPAYYRLVDCARVDGAQMWLDSCGLSFSLGATA
ncbi:MAG: DUF1285 domain-containing protein [Pseudomonadota bacterium]